MGNKRWQDAAVEIEKYLQFKATKSKSEEVFKMNNYKNKFTRKTYNYKSEMEHDACGVGLMLNK